MSEQIDKFQQSQAATTVTEDFSRLDSFIGHYNDAVEYVTGYDLISPKKMPGPIMGQTRPLTRYGEDGTEIVGSEIDMNAGFWEMERAPQTEQRYADVLWHELVHGYQFDISADEGYDIGTSSLEYLLPLNEGQAVFNGDNQGYEEARDLYAELFYDEITDLSAEEIQDRTGESIDAEGPVDLYELDNDVVDSYTGSLLEEISEDYRIDVVGIDADAGQPLYDFVVTDRDMLDGEVNEDDLEQFIYTKYEVENGNEIRVRDDWSYEVDYRDLSIDTAEIGRYMVDVQEQVEEDLAGMAARGERLPSGAVENDVVNAGYT